MAFNELTNLSLHCKVYPPVGELPLNDNQFTLTELMTYMRKAYSSKLNATNFSVQDVIFWVRQGKIPEAYGGSKIYSQRLSGLRILTVVDMSREDLKNVDMIVKERELLIKQGNAIKLTVKAHAIKKKQLPRRTRLYYQTLGVPAPPDALPDDWKRHGIRGKQLMKKRKK